MLNDEEQKKICTMDKMKIKDLRALARMHGIYLMRRHGLIEAIQDKEDELRDYKADVKYT